MDAEERRKKLHRRKMIAPIVVTLLVLAYYFVFFALIREQVQSRLAKLLLGILPALYGGVMIGVCIQRIKEIKGGEEDDLGQY